eukprot:43084_1
MATVKNFKQLKYITPRNKDIVNGYIKNIQILFPWEENSYFTIPPLINYLCLLYYSPRGRFKTDINYRAADLEFIDHKTVKKIIHSNHNLCLFGETISKFMCNIFRIEFTIKAGDTTWCPYFSLLVAENEIEMNEIINNVQNWNISYIRQKDEDGSVNTGSKSYSICLYQGDNTFNWQGSTVIGPKNLKFKIGDRFMLEHNFINCECHAYFNDLKVYTFTIKEQCILPTISMYFTGEIIEITRYEFE